MSLEGVLPTDLRSTASMAATNKNASACVNRFSCSRVFQSNSRAPPDRGGPNIKTRNPEFCMKLDRFSSSACPPRIQPAAILVFPLVTQP